MPTTDERFFNTDTKHELDHVGGGRTVVNYHKITAPSGCGWSVPPFKRRDHTPHSGLARDRLVRVQHDQFFRVSEPEHHAGSLVEQVAVELSGTEQSDRPL